VALVGALVAALAAAAPAPAHVVYGIRTFSQMTAEADAVVRARVVGAERVLVLGDPPRRRTVVDVLVRESVKGELPCGPLTFVPHGHGVARYAAGEDVVLFLRAIGRSRELAGTPLAAAVAWVSEQETADKLVLDRGARDPVLAAVRAYAALAREPSETSRRERFRRLTLAHAGAGAPRVATGAVADLVLAGPAVTIGPDELPALLAAVDDAGVTIGARVALLAELEHRGLVDAAPRWQALLRRTAGTPDGLAVIHAAGAHPSPPVTRALLEVLAGADLERAAAAAVALGSPGNDVAVEPLAEALASPSPRLRMAAIRGLGRIATPAAERKLELAAEFHPDPPTRRRARAERIVLAGLRARAVPLP